MGRNPWIRRRGWGLALGAGVTLALCGLFAVGALDRLDRYGLDLHFRHFSTIQADPRIVLIDIDDSALSTVNRYPWPRRRYAQLIDTLNELGADRIILDIVLSEPNEPRVNRAGLDRYYDVEADVPVLGDPSQDAVIYDDEELAEAIRRSERVYLAMFFQMEGSDRATKRRSDGGDQYRPPLAEQSTIHGSKAEFEAKCFLQLNPRGTWPEFFKFARPDASFEALTPERSELLTAFLELQAQQTVLQSLPTASSFKETAPGLYATEFGTFPLTKLARHARGVGFVSIPRQETDGVVRELPLVAEMDGRLLYQLGILAALDVLGFERSATFHEAGQLVLGTGPDRRRVPWSADGSTLIHWHLPQHAEQWQDSFEHISAARVMSVALNREGVEDNETRLGLALGKLVQLRHADTRAEFARYVEWVNERRALRKRDRVPSPQPSPLKGEGDSEGRLADLDDAIRKSEEEAVEWLRRNWTLWQTAEPENDLERAEKERVRALHEDLAEGRLRDRLARANEALTQRNASILKELESQIRGKICLVGYTASAVADLVATPVYSAMPGVMAHANVINMILQNKPARTAPLAMNLLLFIASGLVVALMTSLSRPLISLASTIVVVLVLLAGGALLFWIMTVHVASVVAALVTVATWAGVTLYRQLVAERARREFQRALAQYTSPAVAARIAEREGSEALAPQPAVVTCFFADLVGFTRLSEQLGPARTREVLNPYLSTLSDVLIGHNALVNKFMGDGVFAFFNSPILRCAQHSEAACACALAAFRALEQGNGRSFSTGKQTPLSMRIGLAGGEVFVGDYGSTTKLDYTCIGDAVNLASRLEKANRELGTRIAVDEATRREAENRFQFRRLGRFLVPGRTEPVEISELVALREGMDPALGEYARHFEHAVTCFQHCDWGNCIRLLEECERIRPDDPLIPPYRTAARNLQRAGGISPPFDPPPLVLGVSGPSGKT